MKQWVHNASLASVVLIITLVISMYVSNEFSMRHVKSIHCRFLNIFVEKPTNISTPLEMEWVQVGSDIDGEESGDRSGFSVEISSDGNTLAIGAPRNDESGIWSCHVRVYKFDGIDWTQVGSDIDGEESEDWSGWSVAMSSDGNTLAVGAPYNDGNGIRSGHVRVYKFDGTDWTQVGSDIDGEE